jgi:nitrate reductase delta subunit
MITFRILSALLDYPSPELKSGVAEAADILRGEGLLIDPHLAGVCEFLAHIDAKQQLDAESAYIETFDRGRSTSLHLFEHIHGESRDRGQAMVRLITRYRMHGLELQSGELPDFLPLFLEFLSTCRPGEAKKYLTEVSDIVALIGERLRKRHSPYAAVLGAIASLAPKPAGDEHLLPDIERDDTPAALDAAWEEAPVTFNDATLLAVERTVNSMARGMERSSEKPEP